MNPVLIFTAGYGEGHNAAARGLKQGFAAIGVQAEVLDLFEPAFGERYAKSRRQYIKVVNEAPWLWASFYRFLDWMPFLPIVLPFLRPLRKAFADVLAKYQPEIVISVYPMYGYLFEEAVLRSGIKRPFNFTVVTDSISVNSIWHRYKSDAFLVPNQDTADVMLAAGVEREKVVVSGFPVSTQFAEVGPERPDLGAGVRPRVLYMINGQPMRAVAIVERILRELEVDLTVTAGKDEELLAALKAVAVRTGKPLEVLGWVADVPALLRRNHLLIGKAGGAMVQEALAAHTPMLVTQVLPGQEEGNARLLTQNGCGVVCPTTSAVVLTMAQLFTSEAVGWKRMHKHTIRLGRPDASREAALWIQSQLGAGAAPENRAFGVREI